MYIYIYVCVIFQKAGVFSSCFFTCRRFEQAFQAIDGIGQEHLGGITGKYGP